MASCPFKNRFHIQLLFHSRHQFHCKVISYFCRALEHLLDLFIYGSNLLDHQRMSISRLQFHISNLLKRPLSLTSKTIERESLQSRKMKTSLFGFQKLMLNWRIFSRISLLVLLQNQQCQNGKIRSTETLTSNYFTCYVDHLQQPRIKFISPQNWTTLYLSSRYTFSRSETKHIKSLE